MKNVLPYLVISFLAWVFNFHYVVIGALLTAWVLLVGTLLIDYAKGKGGAA